MFNFFVLKKIERRYPCQKLSAFTATGDGSNVEPSQGVLKYFFSKRARGSNLEASVMALKTTTYARSRLHARRSICCALASVREAQLNHLLWIYFIFQVYLFYFYC